MSVDEMSALAAGLGDQLRWVARVEAPALPPAAHLVVCGMGGSGIAGDFAAAAATVPVTVHKGYGLPAWVESTRPLVVAVSYSGNTEEVLDAASHAGKLGLSVAWVASGGELAAAGEEAGWPGVTIPSGLPPRASLGYLVGAVMRLMAAAGALPDPESDLNAAADVVEL